jgi:hypothetical protein
VRARLTPGEYLLTADPFRCETERGAGYDQPEIGQTFLVPDYCSWAVISSRGGVQLEQGVAVRLAKPGDAVRAGDVLVTPKRGFAALASRGGEGSAEIGSGSRVTVGEQCGREGGWRLDLAQGTTTAQVKAGAPKGRYVVATPNATSSGQGARWLVGIGRAGGQPRTTVKVLAGRVTVSGRPGSNPVVVPNGLSTVVAGSAPPSKPAR